MLRWLRDRVNDVWEMIADAVDAIRERLFGRGEEEEELRDEVEREEAEEIAEEVEAVEEIAGDVGDEYIIDLIEQLEAEQQEEEQQQEEQHQERQEEEGAEDDAQVIYELYEDTADQLAEHDHLLTNDELMRAEALLDDAAALMDEVRELDEDDRAAAIDLIIEALAAVEAIVSRAVERGEGGDCEEARGPYVSYADAVAYARTIPCPTWVYVDGYGWWWVCIDDCSPERV